MNAAKTKAKPKTKSKAQAKPAAKATAKPTKDKQPPKSETAECPKGGPHEWAEDETGQHCSKCKEPAMTKPAAKKATAKAEPKTKQMSALDAAAKLLAESGEAMNCKQMIEGIATKGYWSSPGGKTPHATLFSAISREISVKGKEARFTKRERGLFAAASGA